MTTLKIIFALAILFSGLFAGWLPFSKKSLRSNDFNFPSLQALAAGIFLGIGLIHMLSDANRGFTNNGVNKYPLAFLLAGAVFLILLFLEHLGREIDHHQNSVSSRWVLLAVSLLSIHSLLAGIALGISANKVTSTMMFTAIMAHKWAASFALAVQINKSDLSRKKAIIYFITFALMTPAGVLFGASLDHFFHHLQIAQAVFLSLAAGTFLYIGTLHGLSQAVMVNRCCNKKEYLFVILGFSMMAVLAI
jgi:solute carrier family 39 (zinc transporter), member 1/2/3